MKGDIAEKFCSSSYRKEKSGIEASEETYRKFIGGTAWRTIPL